MVALLVGFAFGYLGSMPVAGPISVLVLHLGLAHEGRRAFHLALGGALAEGIYALLAFWGLSTVLAAHPRLLPASRVLGAVILLGLGGAMLARRFQGATPASQAPAAGHKRSFVLGFLLTALNPTLVVTWTAAVAALHATGLLAMDRAQALPFAAAASAGIGAWFATLLWLVRRFRSRLGTATLARLSRTLGAGLVLLGGWMLVRHLPAALR